MSLRNLYEISRRSFRVIDARMNVAGQNVANADSAGYARRRVISSADTMSTLGMNAAYGSNRVNGTGVSISDYSRMRDQLLVSAGHRANAQMEFSGEEHRILSSVEGILQPGSGGLNDILSDFWNSWADLANNPNDSGVRGSVVSRANNLAGSLNNVAGQLDRFEEELEAELQASVDQANALLSRIAELNNQIARANNQRSPNFAAEDERDDAIRQLSSLVGVEVQTEHPDGFRIAIGGVFVVEGEHTTPLSLNTATNEIQFGNTGTPFRPQTGGRIGATLLSITEGIDGARARLDGLASTLVEQINLLHVTGFGSNDATGINFFDPSGTSAASISVSADILNNFDNIANASSANAPGDSSMADAIAKLQNADLFSGRTANQEIADMMASIGARVNSAASSAGGHSAVLANLDAMEYGVSGVSVEDEMTAIIELQQAYAATARVLQSAEEMMDTLLAI